MARRLLMSAGNGTGCDAVTVGPSDAGAVAEAFGDAGVVAVAEERSLVLASSEPPPVENQTALPTSAAPEIRASPPARKCARCTFIALTT